jgi:hypothetical protein|eukprot:COSAG06_NODE_2338_length_7054_cov_4.655787_6_plen_201_part_00
MRQMDQCPLLARDGSTQAARPATARLLLRHARPRRTARLLAPHIWLRAELVAAAVLRSAPSMTTTNAAGRLTGSRVHAAPIAAASSCSSGGLSLREHGARLIAGADLGHVDQLRSLGVNAAARASWINQTDTGKCDTRVRALFLDGLTFDFGKRASAGQRRGAVLHPDREGDHGCDARRGAFVRTSPLPCRTKSLLCSTS